MPILALEPPEYLVVRLHGFEVKYMNYWEGINQKTLKWIVTIIELVD